MRVIMNRGGDFKVHNFNEQICEPLINALALNWRHNISDMTSAILVWANGVSEVLSSTYRKIAGKQACEYDTHIATVMANPSQNSLRATMSSTRTPSSPSPR